MVCPKRLSVYLPLIALVFWSCEEPIKAPPPKPTVVVKKPEELKPITTENISRAIDYALQNNGRVADTIRLTQVVAVAAFYKGINFTPVWSENQKWLPIADSLMRFMDHADEWGLMPSEYHIPNIHRLRNQISLDSSARLDAALWARADLMYSDAFMQMLKDLKLGRLPKDSVTMRKDTITGIDFFTLRLLQALTNKSISPVFEALEPRQAGYHELKSGLRDFLDSMDRTPYTYVVYPFTDSMSFIKQLQTRLFESSYITFNTRLADTAELATAIRKAEMDLKIKVDGKFGNQLVKALNNTDREKFIRIAINMDRYKQLPDSMPLRYVFVNLPGFYLQVWDTDTMNMESKVIVGGPQTRSPVLTSRITNFVTLPQWTVPLSIIMKEMLPRIQKDTMYLVKQNLMVVDKNDSVLQPGTINWKKLDKDNFPYLLKQRQGDDNSLGVIKFNFENKYSVYLHDTNARSLFSRNNRALSHGCIRVQDWVHFSHYLIRNDSLRYPVDTVAAWIGRKEKHWVAPSERLPIFIRYFSVIGQNGRVKFFDDIYGDDKYLREKYFRIQ